ncbi:YceI family protein [Roseateles sp. BYS180W]|uniref:YceI family protein n=1 Tax=Roseateles rivi TaxID=3299028 RepID=A0ABW7FWV5_9BURK
MKHQALVAAALLGALSLAQAQSVSYTIEPTHTFVTYEIAHFGTSTNRGRFDKKEGTVQLDRQAKTGRVDISFELASVNTGVPAMDKHLLNKDFFDAEKYPKARFVGEQFSFDGDKVTAVAGQLTLRDQTHPVTLTAQRFNCYRHPMFMKTVCGGDFEATIDRTLWGIDYGIKWGFPKDVKLVIQVEAVQQ